MSVTCHYENRVKSIITGIALHKLKNQDNTAEKDWDSPIQLILSPYFGRALKTGSIQIFLSPFQTMLSPLLVAPSMNNIGNTWRMFSHECSVAELVFSSYFEVALQVEVKALFGLVKEIFG